MIWQIIRLYSTRWPEKYEGQSMDMDFESRKDVTIEEYLKMIELKTSVLIGLSLRFGSKYAGASSEDEYHLYQFGVNAGIGFQLQDDLLDVYGDPAVFGKKVGGDIIQGKKTYLYLRALELLSDAEKINFIEAYADQSTSEISKVSKITEVFNQLYIRTYCEEAKQAFFDLALTHLKCVNVSESKKSELIDFSKALLHRSK